MKDVVILKSRLDCHGGAEKQTRRLIDAFLKQKCTVTLLTSGSPISLSKELTLHSLKGKKWLSFQNVLAFDRFCQNKLKTKSKEAIVFGLDRNSFQTHLRASNGVHAAYLHHRAQINSYFKKVSFHINPLHRVHLALEKKAFTHPRLRLLIVNSHLVEKEVLSYYDVDPKKIVVLHNGVEWKEKEACGREEKEFHFLFIGHNFRRKGLEPLLRGMSLLKDEDVILSVVGKEKNMPYFRSLVQRLGLVKKVRFFDTVANPTPFYQRADALVVPSFYDPFANVTVEALAMGVFVVSSKTNGGSEVLSKETGCTIESLTSPEAVATALKQALRHPKTKERAQIIRSSVQHLDFSHQLKRITELILS